MWIGPINYPVADKKKKTWFPEEKQTNAQTKRTTLGIIKS